MQYTRRQSLCAAIAATTAGVSGEKQRAARQKFALLIGCTQAGMEAEAAALNDLEAIRAALHSRGFQAAEMLTLGGALHADLLFSALHSVRDRITHWTTGDLFLIFSGHGDIDFEATDPEPTLCLTESQISWRQVFVMLSAPPTVSVTLLPDC